MPLVQILVGPESPSIPQGGTQQFRAVSIDNKGQTADITTTAVWTSTNPAVATVDATGLGTGVAPGAATIQASAEGVTGSAAVAVEIVLVSIDITPKDVVLEVGDQQQFDCAGTYSDAATRSLTIPATFVSSNPDVATVDTLGVGKAIAPGVAVIEAQYGGLVAATSIGVKQPAPTITPAEELLYLAQRQLALQAAGQAPLAVETPQLGRVVYQQTSIADLRMLIDQLQAVVYPDAAAGARRRPISVEACP